MEIRLNRPEVRNALTLEGYRALSQALDQATEDDQITVVLIHGVGGHFTSGNDLNDFHHKPPFSQDSPVLGFLRRLASFEKIFIAAVEGWAVGIGTTMLLHCDLTFASDRAKFQLPFVDLGLCPEAASSYLLPRLIGYQKAAELLLTGRVVPAEEAGRIGLVNEVIPQDQLWEKAQEITQLIASKPAQGLLATKKLLWQDKTEILKEVIRTEAQEFTVLLQSEVSQKAFAAFLKKS